MTNPTIFLCACFYLEYHAPHWVFAHNLVELAEWSWVIGHDQVCFLGNSFINNLAKPIPQVRCQAFAWHGEWLPRPTFSVKSLVMNTLKGVGKDVRHVSSKRPTLSLLKHMAQERVPPRCKPRSFDHSQPYIQMQPFIPRASKVHWCNLFQCSQHSLEHSRALWKRQ